MREGLPLPYRGQDIPSLPSDKDLSEVPEGPCRCVIDQCGIIQAQDTNA